MPDTGTSKDHVRIEPRKDGTAMRVRVTESERLIMLADVEGWPIIRESEKDVLVQDGQLYLYWRKDMSYASDNLGPRPKPFGLEAFIREGRGVGEDQKDWRRRAGIGDVGGRRRKLAHRRG